MTLTPVQVHDVPAKRVAAVTGASSGLGVAIAQALAELGWSVAIGARREERLRDVARELERAGGAVFAHALDVTHPESIDAFFRAAEQALGPMEVVVNNAGLGQPGLIHTATPERITHEITTNLIGPIFVVRRVLPSMLERRSGDLVFITSDATRHPRPRQTIYSASKAGLENFQQALSMELEGTGVRAINVRIGPALSEFGLNWDPDDFDTVTYWRHFGLQRYTGYLPPEQVGRAVVVAVTSPRGVLIDTIEVQPEAPLEPAVEG